MESTRRDRYEEGRALRQASPRSSHADWAPRSDRADPIEAHRRLECHAASGAHPDPLRTDAPVAVCLLPRLGRPDGDGPRRTPISGLRVQACGDAHVSNFGEFATPGRTLVFDVNDFDETLPGPWEWDVKRLAVSLDLRGPAPDALAE